MKKMINFIITNSSCLTKPMDFSKLKNIIQKFFEFKMLWYNKRDKKKLRIWQQS